MSDEIEHARWQGQITEEVRSLYRQLDDVRREVANLRRLDITDERVRGLTRALKGVSADLSSLGDVVKKLEEWRLMLMGAVCLASTAAGLVASLLFHWLTEG